MADTRSDRRKVLSTTALALAAGIAGCQGPSANDGDGGNGGDGGEGGNGNATETTTTEAETTATTAEGGDGNASDGGGGVPAAITEYLDADPAAGNFDGNIVDKTDADTAVVTVGAEGNGGNFAFAPPAVRVSTTTISWQWTGKGGLHNVVSTDASDFDFKSGDTKESGDPFEESFDKAGIGLYYCDPHRSLGMEGAFEVVE
jgi:halocyanin-like protein